MKKSKQKDLATSLTVGLFLVIGISGIMMFFRWNDMYVKALHEYLGVGFAIAALLHVLYNWGSMKRYFSKKVFASALVVIVGISGYFVYDASTQSSGKNPKVVLIDSMLNAPLEKTVMVLGTDMESVKVKLESAGLKAEKIESIKTLAAENKTSPFKIVALLTK